MFESGGLLHGMMVAVGGWIHTRMRVYSDNDAIQIYEM